jgi:Holliday junction DNA helicase RuvA
MIAWLEGLLKKSIDTKTLASVILDVRGVGYQVFVTKSVLDRLPADGERLAFDIYTHVKEDSIHLYGFLQALEKEAFEALIGVNGIGPKAAMGILSGIDARELARAVCTADIARLCMIPGIGKKKAERMVMDLKERLLPLSQAESKEERVSSTIADDLRSALLNLGFKGNEAEQAINALRSEMAETASLDILLPKALKQIRG